MLSPILTVSKISGVVSLAPFKARDLVRRKTVEIEYWSIKKKKTTTEGRVNESTKGFKGIKNRQGQKISIKKGKNKDKTEK